MTRVMPPSHAGMVPAALPAFSAPIGVRVVPSLARSLAESSAAAGSVKATPAASAAHVFLDFTDMLSLLVFILVESRLERIAHAERIEVPVRKGVRARAEVRRLRGRHARHVGAAIGAAAEEGRVLHVHH